MKTFFAFGLFAIFLMLTTTNAVAQTATKTPSANNAKNNLGAINRLSGSDVYVNSLIMVGQKALTTRRAGVRCAKVNNDKTKSIFTIDFGAGCATPSGKAITGKMEIAYLAGNGGNTARSITFTNLTVDSLVINGKAALTAVANNSAGQPFIVSNFNGSVQELGASSAFTYEGTHTFTWASGKFADTTAVIEIYGNGTASNGKEVISTKTEQANPCVIDLSCKAGSLVYPIKGITNVVLPPSLIPSYIKSTDGVFIIDFGTGTCDNKVSVTYNKKTKNGTVVPVTIPVVLP